jgi:hypothetical protein
MPTSMTDGHAIRALDVKVTADALRGEGIHWPELDEDISVEGLLAGRRSGESREALKRWLKSRSSIRLRKRTPAVTTRARRG